MALITDDIISCMTTHVMNRKHNSGVIPYMCPYHLLQTLVRGKLRYAKKKKR